MRFFQKNKVGDTLLADTRAGSRVPKLEETIEQVNAKNVKAKEAFLGYASFDVLHHEARLIFSKYNPRPLVKAQVQALVQLFHVDGVDRFNPQFSIPLIVNKDLLREGCWTVDVETGDSLPELEIAEDADSNWTFMAAGGQHRVAALKEWLERKGKQLKELQWEESKILAQDVEGVDTGALAYLNKKLKVEREELEGVLRNEGRWMVALFDNGKHLCSLFPVVRSVHFKDPLEMHNKAPFPRTAVSRISRGSLKCSDRGFHMCTHTNPHCAYHGTP